MVKNALLGLRWKVAIDDENYDDEDPELLKQVKIAEYCLQHPNLQDSYRTLFEAVIEDFLMGGYGCIEPQLTPDYRRPIKMWPVDGCVDDKTEVLTKRGWVKWPEVISNDIFATKNLTTQALEYQKGELKKYRWKGNLLKFDSHDVEMMLTPNHRVLGKHGKCVWRNSGDKKWLWSGESFTPASDVAKIKRVSGNEWPFKIPMISKWEGKLPDGVTKDGRIPITLLEGVHRISLPGIKGFQSFPDKEQTYWLDLKDWIAFLGIYIAEGSVNGVMGEKKKPSGWHYIKSLAASVDFEAAKRLLEVHKKRLYSCVVSQKKSSRWYREIKNLLDGLPFNFHEKNDESGFTTTHKGLHGYLFPLGNKYTKRIPQWVKDLPPKYLEIFIDWACKGDGYVREKTGLRTYITTSKNLADDMQEVFQKIGGSASISVSKAGNSKLFGKWYKKAPCFSVQERKRDWVGVGDAREVPYDGYVYCATVPNGTLYMRRSGFPFWTGNSTIRIYADWTEATPDRPHYAQLTGLKGERGIISFLDDELVYIRDNVRSSTPFGLGKMEVCFLTINAFLGAQDMSARAAADQIHKTWLWWTTNLPPGQFETIQRHIQNEAEGQAKISLSTGMPKPEVIEVNPVTPEDLLMDWQTFCIRIIAAGFDLSPMSLGLERDVNRSTAAVMSEQDFNSAIVPAARKLEEAITRFILHRTLGWQALKFEYIGLDDPDEVIQAQLVGRLYQVNAITPDEIRERMQIGAPLPGGWGKLTMGQMQLITQAAVGKGGGGGAGASGGGGGGFGSSGMGMGSSSIGTLGMAADFGYVERERTPQIVASLDDSPFSADDLAQMDPQELEQFRQAGVIPYDPQQLQEQMEAQSPGILQTLSEELQEYFEWLEQEEDADKPQPAKISNKDQTEQKKKFTDKQRQIDEVEKAQRTSEKFRTGYETRNYRGPFPKKAVFPKGLGKNRSTPKNFTGRIR